MTHSTAGKEVGNAYNYNHEQLKSLLEELIRKQVSMDAWEWLLAKSKAIVQPASFNATFAAIPRKTGKQLLQITSAQEQAINDMLPGCTMREWTVDRLSRVWLLMHADPSDKENYFRLIENLFLSAEMNELVALYSSLPLLAYPDMWVMRCAEGIRTNIGDVLQAIMYDNPYPGKHLPEPAWNQLVLKAFFTEKSIPRIIGIEERSNQELANILSDYAHERWAAHRPVHPQLWRFVSRHLNEFIFPDIKKIAASELEIEKQAAALVCYETNYPPAKKLLDQFPDLLHAIKTGKLTWSSI